MLACILHLDGRASAQFGALAKDFMVRVLCCKSLQGHSSTLCMIPTNCAGHNVYQR